MKDKEETLKNLLKSLLEERLSYLEKRNLNQVKDLKFEADAFNKQEILVKKLCSIKIETKKPPASKNNKINKIKATTNKSRDKTPVPKSRSNNKDAIKKEIKGKRSVTPDISTRNLHTKKKDTEKGKAPITKNKTETQLVKKNPKANNNTINKTKPYSMTNNNESKNNEKNIKNKTLGKRSLTADIQLKNKNKKPNRVNKNTENNLKLVNLKIENTKTETKKNKKNEKKNNE